MAVRRQEAAGQQPAGGLHEDLLGRIREGTARIAVVGLGHVGLPTAVLFADTGYPVTGVDVREDLVQAIASGEIQHDEPALADLLERVVRRGSFQVTTGMPAAVQHADVVIVCVQTPVTPNRTPDLHHLRGVCEVLGANLRPGQLVVIESTVPPGTTHTLVAETLEKRSGLKCGTAFWLAHCPERMAPGNGFNELTTTPRLIGGIDGPSTRAAAELFRKVTTGEVIAASAGAAEVAKLAENTYRAVNIAFANELAVLCENIGVNVADVIRLANSHPRVAIHTPGPGVGGPCVPKDPDLLIHAARKHGLRLNVVLAARATNDRMPAHVCELVRKAMANTWDRNGKPKVAILGTAYKAGVPSSQDSPSKKVIQEIMTWGVDVVVHDPYCQDTFGAEAATDLPDAVKGSDCIIVMTDHSEYKTIDLALLRSLMNPGAAIVDTRRILNPADVTSCGIPYLGVGVGEGVHADPRCDPQR